MIQNYSDLQAEIASWLHRSDLTARIPSFIQFAEARINNELRLSKMVRYRTLNVAGPLFDRPADFLEMVMIGPTDRADCEYDLVTPRQIRGTQGDFYAYVGDQIRLLDGATDPRNVDLVYYARLPALSEAQSTWLLSDQPDLYLYGALAHSAPFLKDDPRIATWEAGYQAAKMGQEGAEQAAKWSGNSLVIRNAS
jgi:hypothetical protein